MRIAKIIGAAAVAVAVVAGLAGSAQAQLKPEDQLKVREGLMLATKLQAGPLLGFAQGKNDLPADAVARAEAVAALAKASPIAWAKGTESVKGSDTKPEAFTSPEFAKGWDAMGAAATKLADAAKAGDAEATKAAAGGLGKTCKSCHENFKKD